MTFNGRAIRTAPLGSLVSITGGGTPSKRVPDYFTGFIPWVTPKDMKSWFIDDAEDHITDKAISNSSASLIEPGAVLICIRSGVLAHTLPVAINRVVVALNQDMKALRCKEGLHAPYLARYLKWYSPRLLRTVRGTTAHNLSMDVIRQIEVPLPPLSDQKRIADILDKADAIRRKRREALKRLSDLIDSRFLTVFGDPLSNPKHWEPGTFDGHLTLVQYGPRFFNESYSADGIRIVRITDLDQQGNLDYSAMPRMTVSEKDRESFILRPGDLLLARSGATVGKTALIDDAAPECIAGAYFIRLRFTDEIRPLYAQLVLRSKPVQKIIAERSRQSAQQNFNGPAIRALPLPVPPIALQDQFLAFHRKVTQSGRSFSEATHNADDLFNTLVQRAFQGRL